MTNSMDSMDSIASIAEDIMNNANDTQRSEAFHDIISGDTSPKAVPKIYNDFENLPDSKDLDVRDIEVPDDFVALAEATITGKEIAQNVSKKPKVSVEVPIKEISGHEKIQQLITSLKALLSEAKQVIEEMTTCGMIGVNMGGPGLKPKDKKIKKKKKSFRSIVDSILKDEDK